MTILLWAFNLIAAAAFITVIIIVTTPRCYLDGSAVFCP